VTARPGVLACLAQRLRAAIDWLRAGYCDEAPQTGYSPLIALQGPIALSEEQTAEIVDDLEGHDSDRVDIEVAITKATDRLPTDNQIRRIERALHEGDSPPG
jgi:hypothetical protein